MVPILIVYEAQYVVLEFGKELRQVGFVNALECFLNDSTTFGRKKEGVLVSTITSKAKFKLRGIFSMSKYLPIHLHGEFYHLSDYRIA